MVKEYFENQFDKKISELQTMGVTVDENVLNILRQNLKSLVDRNVLHLHDVLQFSETVEFLKSTIDSTLHRHFEQLKNHGSLIEGIQPEDEITLEVVAEQIFTNDDDGDENEIESDEKYDVVRLKKEGDEIYSEIDSLHKDIQKILQSILEGKPVKEDLQSATQGAAKQSNPKTTSKPKKDKKVEL